MKNSAVMASGAALTPSLDYAAVKQQKDTSTKRLLNGYYLRAHMYTMVPRQVREDMKWMAGIGTNILTIAVLEQDFEASNENISIIINEAHKEGIKVFALPSHWGGIVAGAPKVPAIAAVTLMIVSGSWESNSISKQSKSANFFK